MGRRSTTGRLALRGILTPLLGAMILGCASDGIPIDIYKKGQTSPNVYLSTVIVRPGGCAPFGAACTLAGPGGAVLIVPFDQQTPRWMYEIFAHEMCHVVAGVQELRGNPCHREDHGSITMRRIDAGGAVHSEDH